MPVTALSLQRFCFLLLFVYPSSMYLWYFRMHCFQAPPAYAFPLPLLRPSRLPGPCFLSCRHMGIRAFRASGYPQQSCSGLRLQRVCAVRGAPALLHPVFPGRNGCRNIVQLSVSPALLPLSRFLLLSQSFSTSPYVYFYIRSGPPPSSAAYRRSNTNRFPFRRNWAVRRARCCRP